MLPDSVRLIACSRAVVSAAHKAVLDAATSVLSTRKIGSLAQLGVQAMLSMALTVAVLAIAIQVVLGKAGFSAAAVLTKLL